MAANMTEKTFFIIISGHNDVIIENKVSKPMFLESRNSMELYITTTESPFPRYGGQNEFHWYLRC